MPEFGHPRWAGITAVAASSPISWEDSYLGAKLDRCFWLRKDTTDAPPRDPDLPLSHIREPRATIFTAMGIVKGRRIS